MVGTPSSEAVLPLSIKRNGCLFVSDLPSLVRRPGHLNQHQTSKSNPKKGLTHLSRYHLHNRPLSTLLSHLLPTPPSCRLPNLPKQIHLSPPYFALYSSLTQKHTLPPRWYKGMPLSRPSTSVPATSVSFYRWTPYQTARCKILRGNKVTDDRWYSRPWLRRLFPPQLRVRGHLR